MIGIHAKRGIATTLERVFKNTGNAFNKLEIFWTGTTAGIIFNKYDNGVLDAKLIFPAIDETVEISPTKFSNLIGYALHELGHAWFTTNRPWDLAREKHGKFVSNLFNGLEDPRIELKVIESGYAPNSRALFVDLINSVLSKDGYVDPTEKCQIPFILAVEGRRLNGYDINVPNIIDQSPYAKHLHWALDRARIATNTADIVKIAIKLFELLKEQDQQDEEEELCDEGDQQGNEKGDQQGDQQGDGEGADGNKPSDQDGDQPSDKSGDEPSDKPSNKGKGKGSYDDKGRDVEPTSFIEEELENKSSTVDDGRPRPIVLKPVVETFEWR